MRKFLSYLGLLAFAAGCGSGAPDTPGHVCGFEDASACDDAGSGTDSGQPIDPCLEIGCSAHQACGVMGTRLQCLEGKCKPGYEYDTTTSSCRAVIGRSCGTEGVGAIGAECTSLHRACSTSSTGASCGGCLPGFSMVDGHCASAACDALGCSAEHRPCVPLPAPHCDDACVEGYVWEADISACREALTCAELTCGDQETCIDGAAGQDAQCKSSCPAGQGVDPFDSVCRACGAGVLSPASCDGEGETGRVWVTGSSDGSTCICETYPGYFVGNAGNRAQACDGDEDGWVTDSAYAAIEGDNAYRQANARCELRSVAEVILRNEAGDEREPIPVAVDNGGGAVPLPLYETDRNDGAASAGPIPAYDTETNASPLPRAVNSLTKACVSPIADFNHNGVEDVAEWAESTLDVASGLAPYYQAYARFSYFFELYDSWYEPGAVNGGPGRLVIRERPRTLGHADIPSVPLAYNTASSYWRECGRHPDPHYDGPVASYAGADFYQFYDAGSSWGGMLHHSQFKCVHVVSLNDYAGDGLTASKSPEKVWLDDASNELFWSDGSLAYEINECAIQVQTFASPSAVANPIFPTFACTDPGTDPTPGTVAWAITPYYHATAEPEGPAPHYVRGCINECADLGVSACPTYVGGAGDAFVCDMSSDNDFGRIVCGCGEDFSGPSTSCSMGCPNNGLLTQHFTQSDFEIFHRTGYWACIDPMVSGAAVTNGDGYTLRSGVPRASTSGETLTGGGYSVSGRIRHEVHVIP